MKRHPRLIQFSREHHLSLRLGRDLQRDGDVAGLRAEHDGLLAHFAAEERDLLPILTENGEPLQAGRLLAEHARLRELFRASLAGEEGAAAAAGQTLIEHVRYEERELFPLLESFFDDA